MKKKLRLLLQLLNWGRSLPFVGVVFLYGCTRQELPVDPVITDDWSIMVDTLLTAEERFSAHRRMKSNLESWDSSLVLMQQLGADKRDVVLEALFRHQRSEQFLIRNDGLVEADTAGADLRWLIHNRKRYKLEDIFLESRLLLLPHYLSQAEIDSALVYIDRHEDGWDELEDYNRFEQYKSAIDVFTIQGDYIKALLFLKKAISDAKEIERPGCLYQLYGKMGAIMYALELTDQTLVSYNLSLMAYRQIPVENQAEYGPIIDFLVTKIITTDSEKSAKAYYEKGLSRIGDEFEQYLKISLHRSLATFYVLNGQYEKALEPITKGVDCARGNRLPVATLSFQVEQVKLLNKLLRYQSSVKLALSIEQGLAEKSMRGNLLTVYEELSHAYNKLRQPDRSTHYLRLANSLREEIGATKKVTIDVVMLMNGYEKEEQQIVSAQEKLLAKERLNRQELITYAAVIGFLLSLLILYLAWKANKFKREAISLLTVQRRNLELTNKRLNQFVSTVSHDILSRIDLLLSIGNFVSEEKPRPEKLEKYFVTSHQTSQQLKEYCFNLLQEARSGKSSSVTGTAEVERIIDGVIKSYAAELNQLNFLVVREKMTAASLPPVVIQQLIHNTLSNAIKYVPTQGTTPIIRFASRPAQNGDFQWSIEDNGPGLKRKRAHKLLVSRSLFSTDGGTKMGLSLLKAQLSVYGAGLTVHKSELGGLKISVATLPIKRTLDYALPA